MAVTVSGTSITFNDATVQTTAASGPPTTFGVIGSVVTAAVVGYYNNGSSFALDSTYTGIRAYTENTSAQGTGFITQPGTWRCIGGMAGAYVNGGPQSNMLQGLFVRVS